MKKLTTMLCALLILCLAGSACAEIPSSDLYIPAVSETFRTLVGEKTFEARIDGKECYGEDEDSRYSITVTVCEETRYAPDIENLKANDIIAFAPGRAVMATEVTSDEFGIHIQCGDDVGYSFTKGDDGSYTVRTETDNIQYTDLFTITVPLEKDISFLDWSDPENLEAPVNKGYDELLELLLEDTNFAPYNTRLTFDGNGKLVEFLYTYSPWN